MPFLQDAMRSSTRNKKSSPEKKEIKQYLDLLHRVTKYIKWNVEHGVGDFSAKLALLFSTKEELRSCYAHLENILAELYSIKWEVKDKPGEISPTDTTALFSTKKIEERNFKALLKQKRLEYLERQHHHY